MKARHLWKFFDVVSVALMLMIIVPNALTGSWMTLAVQVLLFVAVWYMSRRLISLGTTRGTKADMELYREAEKRILAMDVNRFYRSGEGVFLTRLRKTSAPRVMRIRSDAVELPRIDELGMMVSETFTLLPKPPLVHHRTDADRVDIDGEGQLDVQVKEESGWIRLKDAFREIRFMSKTGVNLASHDELQELVEQLRAAEPFEE